MTKVYTIMNRRGELSAFILPHKRRTKGLLEGYCRIREGVEKGDGNDQRPGKNSHERLKRLQLFALESR